MVCVHGRSEDSKISNVAIAIPFWHKDNCQDGDEIDLPVETIEIEEDLVGGTTSVRLYSIVLLNGMSSSERLKNLIFDEKEDGELRIKTHDKDFTQVSLLVIPICHGNIMSAKLSRSYENSKVDNVMSEILTLELCTPFGIS